MWDVKVHYKLHWFWLHIFCMRGNNKFYEPLVPQKLSNLKSNTVFDSHLKLKYLLHYLIINPRKKLTIRLRKYKFLIKKKVFLGNNSQNFYQFIKTDNLIINPKNDFLVHPKQTIECFRYWHWDYQFCYIDRSHITCIKI